MRSLILSFLPCVLAAQVAPGSARIQGFQATAKAVRRGGTVTLRWSATGADQVRLDPLGLILPAKGEITHLITDKTIYWLHVTNSTGGQSVPLVVDLLPEDPAPTGPAAPSLLPIEPPKMAVLPRVMVPQTPAIPAALPVAMTTPATSRVARQTRRRRAWIQFAATASSKGAAKLQRQLQRVAATDSTLVLRNRRSGRSFQLVRSGPFPSIQEARLYLQKLSPAMQALKISPIIVVGPLQPTTPGITYLADSRKTD